MILYSTTLDYTTFVQSKTAHMHLNYSTWIQLAIPIPALFYVYG